jgi:AAA+ ATPase superfamily predicted ATPase
MFMFIGRESELQRLKELKSKKVASFAVVRGRRRIGKTRLINEFGKGFDKFYSFTGLAPDKKTTNQMQLNEFSRQMARAFNTYVANFTDWSDAFFTLASQVQSGSVLLLLDEISWMGSKDETFLPKIKNLWDLYLKKNDKLIFIICGSVSSWIETNIMQSTGFVGRISFTLKLNELPLSVCRRFWHKDISAYEIFKVLAVTGGVPKYLEEIDPKKTAEDNIRRLCFTSGGLLVEEFEQIFSNTFQRNSDAYIEILYALANGIKTAQEIVASINVSHRGRIYEYLEELTLAGFVTRDYTWDLKTAQDVKSSNFRLSDNYIRFYIKYIAKNLDKMSRGLYAVKSLTTLNEWDCIMGLQFENLVINNRYAIQKILGILPEDVLNANPYFQNKTSQQNGCQIDYMLQTKYNCLYVCEIKYSKHPIGMDVIDEVCKKIAALRLPKGMSCRAVLIHVNGVTKNLIEEDYFSNIIDFSEMLN